MAKGSSSARLFLPACSVGVHTPVLARTWLWLSWLVVDADLPRQDRATGGMIRLGDGCCKGLSENSEYFFTEGITFGECMDLCLSQRPRCASLEHVAWAHGSCALYSSPATTLGCRISEKVCWTIQAPANSATPSQEETLPEAELDLDSMRRWHAQEVWNSMDCLGKANFDHVRQRNLSEIVFNHHGFWTSLLAAGVIQEDALEDTDSFFSPDKNRVFLSQIIDQAGRFNNLLRGDVDVHSDRRERALSNTQPCIFGFLFLLHLAFLRFKDEATGEARKVAVLLRSFLWSQLGGVESQQDLLQSSSWGITSWDVVAATYAHARGLTLPDGSTPSSYEEYQIARPTPQATLPSAFELVPAAVVPKLSRKRLLPCGADNTARIATFGIVRQMQMHQLSALHAAWEMLCGTANCLPKFEVIFVYTPAGPMSEYETGSGDDRVVDWKSEPQQWLGMTVRFIADFVIEKVESFEDVEADVQAQIRGGDATLRNSDVMICGEPVYLCTALNRFLEAERDARPLLAHLGMALLHHPRVDGTVVDTREKVARFMSHFFGMLARPATSVSVANRITMEQVFWQVGVRLPVAHFAGLHLTPRARRRSAPEALLFRTKFPALAHTYLRALKLFFKRERSAVQLVDMNHHVSLSWDEIGSFQAAVLLPHNVHLIRTADLYSLELMLFVPSAPFIFQFIFPGSNLYAGHGGHPAIRLGLDREAQQILHRAFGLSETGYQLGTAPTAAYPGEELPRPSYRSCSFRTPALGACQKARGVFEPCPWGSLDLESHKQQALSCAEVLESEPVLRPLTGSICTGSYVNETGAHNEESAATSSESTAYDPFDFLYGEYNPWCGLDAYRYWYSYTEYAMLHGLQYFGSTAELLEGLTKLLLEEGAEDRRERILRDMRAHQRVRQRETVHWWAQALLLTTRTSRKSD